MKFVSKNSSARLVLATATMMAFLILLASVIAAPAAFASDIVRYQNYRLIQFALINPGTCQGAPGTWTVNSQPAHGKVTTGVISALLTDGYCPGVYFQKGAIYYAWTDPTTGNATDSFTATWTQANETQTLTFNFALVDGQIVETGKVVGDCYCHPGDKPAGDPVSIASGNLFEQVTDYTTTGLHPLALKRYYNSFATTTKLLLAVLVSPQEEDASNQAFFNGATDLGGGGWRTNYDRFLVAVATSPAIVFAEGPDGRTTTFTQAGSGWITDTDVGLRLAQNGSSWTLTDTDDTVETYTSVPSGLRLASITARGGYTQTLSYDSLGQLAAVRDSYGRALKFTYSNGQITSVATPDNTTITYGYSISGNDGTTPDRLTSVTYSTSPASTVSYLYENSQSPFQLTGMIDENGVRFATWSYDDAGRVLSSQHAGGADLTSFAYNDIDGSRTVTNALGEQEVDKFAPLQGVSKLVEADRLATTTTAAATRTLSYDANGYLASQTDWNGNLTTYVNEARGLPVTIVEASGSAQARTTTITWSPSFHVPTRIVTPGLATSFTYDGSGNPLTRTDASSAAARTWTYRWSNALLASVQGPRTDLTQLTTFSYGSHGQLTAVTNALGQTTQITASLPGGLPTAIVDPNGVQTKLAYDARQRLLGRTVVTAAGNRTTRFTYDPAGNLTRTTLPDGSFLANTYDTAHRLTATADALGELIAYGLDALSDPLQTTISTSGGNTVWQNLAAFDALGRLIQDQRGAGQTTAFGYDGNGNVVAKVDPLSRTTKYAIDALNRVVQVADPAGGLTKLSYDSHDRPTRVIAANGATTVYTYDGLGRVIQRASPDTGTGFFYYDLADNLTQMTDGAGAITHHAYDALNRPIATSYPADSPENVAFAYDQAGHGFGIGRLTSVADAVGALGLTYDEQGNELSAARTSGAVSLVTGYGYDLASRIAAVTYPSGSQVTYGRDAVGQITAIKAKVGGATRAVASGITYEPFGPMTGMTYGNGIVETRGYDGDYRLANLTTGTVQALGYGYDAADNVTALADGVTPAKSQAFSHDVLDHLTAASGIYGSLAWQYDLVGNRRTETGGGASGAAYSYLAHSNRLSAITAGGETETFDYTGSGSIAAITPASGATMALTYNQAERLVSVASGGTTIAGYGYDGFGQRFSKSLLTSGSLFQYDQSGRLLEETDVQGALKTDTIYLNGAPVASIAGGALSFLHTDRLGTPQLATSATQSLVWGATYEPFGNLDGQPSGALTQNLRFPGQYADTETGYYQNGFRDYGPLLGRYLESDPIGLASGMNTYGYVGQNPQTNYDRTGLDVRIYQTPSGHQFVQIDTKIGSTNVGFGPSTLAGLQFGPSPGRIDINSGYANPENSTLIATYPLTNEAGKQFVDTLQRMDSPTYSPIGFGAINCRQFACAVAASTPNGPSIFQCVSPLGVLH